MNTGNPLENNPNKQDSALEIQNLEKEADFLFSLTTEKIAEIEAQDDYLFYDRIHDLKSKTENLLSNQNPSLLTEEQKEKLRHLTYKVVQTIKKHEAHLSMLNGTTISVETLEKNVAKYFENR